MNKPNRNHFHVDIKTRKTPRLVALFVLALAILALLVAIVKGQCGPHGCPIGNYSRSARPFPAQLRPPFQLQPRTARPAHRFPQPETPPSRRPITTAPRSIVLVDNTYPTAARTTRSHPITGWVCAHNETWTYIATAAHLITDRVGDLRVDVAGTPHAAEIAGLDPIWDILVLAIAKADRQPLTVATTRPPIGTPVQLHGRTSGTTRGRIARYVAPKNDRHKYEMIDVAGTLARSGDSGGPICNNAGHVVGMIAGSDPNYTTGTATPRLTRILQNIVTSHWGSTVQGSAQPTPTKARPQQNQPEPKPALRPQNPPAPIAAELTQENLDRIAKRIFADMTAHPEPFRGPAGPAGTRRPPAEPAAPPGPPPRLYWEIIPRN